MKHSKGKIITQGYNLKDKKGISLASVLVTVIVVIIVLTSIVYSNNRTKEIQQAMLLNSDIEQLSKKVEIYYLEKQTLPIDETDKYVYRDDTFNHGINDPEDPKYYRIQLSLLDNLNLNNKEIIDTDKSGTLTDEDIQWYIINKETHTIYFVQNEGGNVSIKKAKYDEAYNSILSAATANGVEFNKVVSDSTPAVGNTSIAAGIDSVLSDTSSLGVSNDVEHGTNKTPNIDGATGRYNGVFDYTGYKYGHTPGTKATNLVLHYDGEYNTLSGNTLSHNTSAKTWSDLSGNGQDAYIARNSTWLLEHYYNSDVKTCDQLDLHVLVGDDNRILESRNISSVWEDYALSLKNNEFVLSPFYQKITCNLGEIHVKERTDDPIPNGTEEFSIEITFERTRDYDNKSLPLMGNGYYTGGYTEPYWNKTKNWVSYNDYVASTSDIDWGRAFYEFKNSKKVGLDTNKTNAKNKIGNDYKKPFEDKVFVVESNYNNLNRKITGVIQNVNIRIMPTWEYISIFTENVEDRFILSDRYWYGFKTAFYRLSGSTEGIYPEYVRDLYIRGKNNQINLSPHYGYTRTYLGTKMECNLGVHTVTMTFNNNGDKKLRMYMDAIEVIASWDYYISEDVYIIGSELTIGAAKYIEEQMNSVNEEEYNSLMMQYEYTEFLNEPVYSVRVYNKALSDNEIKRNYYTDMYRFGSGI